MFERDFGGERIEVVRSRDDLILRGSRGEERLTPEEARRVQRTPSLEYELAKRGLDLPLDLLPDRERPALRTLADQVPRDRTAVMLDTTTCTNALSAVEETALLTPVMLLDLAIFTSAAVLFDLIVVQPAQAVRRHWSRVEDFTRVLTYDQEFIDGPMTWAFREVSQALEREQADYEQRWAVFLGVDPAEMRLEIDRVEGYQESDNWTGIVADYFHDALNERALYGGDDPRNDRGMFLAVQTIRTGFNDCLAAALELPYLASSIRIPVSSRLLRRKNDLLRTLDPLLKPAGPPPASAPASSAGVPRPVTAPLLLAHVLQDMEQPGDYWKLLAELRGRFAPFREQVFQDREEALWESAPNLYVKRFHKHLGDATTAHVRAQAYTEAAMTAGSTVSGVDGGLTSLALKLLKVIGVFELSHRGYLRTLRPEIYLLYELGKESRSLSILDERIGRIWGSRWSASLRTQFERLATTEGALFVKPGLW